MCSFLSFSTRTGVLLTLMVIREKIEDEIMWKRLTVVGNVNPENWNNALFESVTETLRTNHNTSHTMLLSPSLLVMESARLRASSLPLSVADVTGMMVSVLLPENRLMLWLSLSISMILDELSVPIVVVSLPVMGSIGIGATRMSLFCPSVFICLVLNIFCYFFFDCVCVCVNDWM